MSGATVPKIFPLGDWTIRPWTERDEDVFETIATEPTITEFLGEIEGACPVGCGPVRFPSGYITFNCAVVHSPTSDVVGLMRGGGQDHIELDLAILPEWRLRGAGSAAFRIACAVVFQLNPAATVGGVVRRDNTAMLALVASLGRGVRASSDRDYLEVV